jgi:UDPglucose 6-dehydrogenase
MKIGIIGLGVIGSACKYGFEKLGHKVLVHDISMGTKLNDLIKSEIIYVCVPTPSNEDGSCNTSIVESVIHEIKNMGYEGIVAIKSTVKPTTTQKLKDETGMKICFVPEFLRERCAISDFTENHDLLAVGTDDEDVYKKIVKCHGKYPKAYDMLTPTEAELLKYYSNVFNAVRIIFANEMYEICKTVDADYSKVKDAFIKRGTTKDIYLDVNENFRGYGGVCLPKDTAALASFVKELKLEMDLFHVIDNENKKFKVTVFDGMRK